MPDAGGSDARRLRLDPLNRQSSAPHTARADGNTADRLRDLKALHDDGVLTDEEHEQRRARLVEEL